MLKLEKARCCWAGMLARGDDAGDGSWRSAGGGKAPPPEPCWCNLVDDAAGSLWGAGGHCG
jgi:hypothetical protein